MYNIILWLGGWDNHMLSFAYSVLVETVSTFLVSFWSIFFSPFYTFRTNRDLAPGNDKNTNDDENFISTDFFVPTGKKLPIRTIHKIILH